MHDRGYAGVSGLPMYYEVQGSGSPVILLHGGMLTIDLNFGSLISILAGRHQTIGVELRATAGRRTAAGRSPRRHWPGTSSRCWTT